MGASGRSPTSLGRTAVVAASARRSHEGSSTKAVPTDALLADYQLFHVEADLRWIDHTVSRLATTRPDAVRYE
jgi:hypothetical protein